MRETLKIYILEKWWIPVLSFIAFCIPYCLSLFSTSNTLVTISGYIFIFGIFVLLAAGIWQVIKGKWYWGVIQLGALLAGIFFLIVISTIASISGPDRDTFSDDLTIPENIELFEVTPWKNNQKQPQVSYHNYILASLSQPSNNSTKVSANLFSLDSLITQSPETFHRYIASSPAWRVFEEKSEKFATRRWNIDNNWRYELHGYYSEFSFIFYTDSIPSFQNRFTIGLDGAPWAKNLSESTSIDLGEETNVTMSVGNRQPESHCVIQLKDIVVEIFDQSPNASRCMTQSAIDFTEMEFGKLLKIGVVDTINKYCSSSDTSELGKEIFELHGGGQGGKYDSEIWINPGEPGKIYLKAFEVSKNIQLSENRLKEKSNEWIGWSENPTEMFYSSTNFTIYEGDWDKHYAARFEVWFVPDNGNPEKKLTEKIFKIEGWMR